MADRMQVYKCDVCGNIVEVTHAGKGVLACCNQPMKLMAENTVEASLEKHVPVVEKTQDGVAVKVGSVAHPMEEKHYIEWIEIVTPAGCIERQYLTPGQEPKASFAVKGEAVTAREYCSLHGLWKS
ncbi:MAG TPA: desulfoferrodoxin [Syntrophorhabdales bacterium]|nr:desulfoferrodoxin [Syntrophorhabdales bacterium]